MALQLYATEWSYYTGCAFHDWLTRLCGCRRVTSRAVPWVGRIRHPLLALCFGGAVGRCDWPARSVPEVTGWSWKWWICHFRPGPRPRNSPGHITPKILVLELDKREKKNLIPFLKQKCWMICEVGYSQVFQNPLHDLRKIFPNPKAWHNLAWIINLNI